MIPPGWHKDPQNPHILRWWDGQQWTSHTAPNQNKGIFRGLSVFGVGLIGAPVGFFIGILGLFFGAFNDTGSKGVTTFAMAMMGFGGLLFIGGIGFLILGIFTLFTTGSKKY